MIYGPVGRSLGDPAPATSRRAVPCRAKSGVSRGSPGADAPILIRQRPISKYRGAGAVVSRRFVDAVRSSRMHATGRKCSLSVGGHLLPSPTRELFLARPPAVCLITSGHLQVQFDARGTVIRHRINDQLSRIMNRGWISVYNSTEIGINR